MHHIVALFAVVCNVHSFFFGLLNGQYILYNFTRHDFVLLLSVHHTHSIVKRRYTLIYQLPLVKVNFLLDD